MIQSANEPVLSVIVAMYQSVATIGQTLRSVLADDVEGGLEVVVVDDGSTDGGARVVGEFVRRDRRVRLVHRANGGLAAARNTGIAQARGVWLRILDADDLATPGSAGGLIACAMARHLPGACGAHALIDERGEPMGRLCPAQAGPDGTIGIDELLGGNRCGVGTVVVRAAALGAERFDETLRVCEDWELWMRLASGGLRLAVRTGPAAKLYRVRRGSLSKDFGAMLRVGQDVLARAFVRERARGVVGLDVSPEREGRAMAGLALEWATMQALSETGGALAGAVEMFRFRRGTTFDGAQAAHAAHWGGLLGFGLRPEIASEERRRWLGRTRAWWACCAEHGWLAAEEIERAWEGLGSLAVLPEEIARTCVAEAIGRGVGELVVVGMGVNGRALAEVALGMGVSVVGRDARIDSGRLADAELFPGITTEPMDAPIPRHRAVLLSPSDDAALLERFGATSPIRWTVVQRRLGGDMKETMREEAGNGRIRSAGMSRSNVVGGR